MIDFNQYSLYGNTDINNNQRNYYEPIDISYDLSDIFVLITTEYHQKPGKLSNFLYGTPHLYWIFTYFNRDEISDIIFDLREGMIIRVPTKERLMSYF